MGEIILLGLIIGIIFYEITDISPGGIVVPGMMAYYIYNPARIGMTLIISIGTFFLMELICKYLIIYGRRKFVLHILVAILLSALFAGIGNLTGLNLLLIPTVGYIIPGIISNEMNKQGPLKTIIALLIVTALVATLVLII